MPRLLSDREPFDIAARVVDDAYGVDCADLAALAQWVLELPDNLVAELAETRRQSAVAWQLLDASRAQASSKRAA